MEWISRPLWMSLFYKILHLWLFLLLLLPLILPLLSCLYSSKLFSVLISSWWLLVCRDGRGVVVLQTVRVHWLQLQLIHQRVSCLFCVAVPSSDVIFQPVWSFVRLLADWTLRPR